MRPRVSVCIFYEIIWDIPCSSPIPSPPLDGTGWGGRCYISNKNRPGETNLMRFRRIYIYIYVLEISYTHICVCVCVFFSSYTFRGKKYYVRNNSFTRRERARARTRRRVRATRLCARFRALPIFVPNEPLNPSARASSLILYTLLLSLSRSKIYLCAEYCTRSCMYIYWYCSTWDYTRWRG